MSDVHEEGIILSLISLCYARRRYSVSGGRDSFWSLASRV